MKKILLTLAIAIAGYCSSAQTNTFPSSGNAGIGTLAPIQPLTIPITSNANGISLGTYSSLTAGNFAFIGTTGADGTFNPGSSTDNGNGAAGMLLIHTSGGVGNSTELAFVTHNNGTDSKERIRIDRFGNMGIGTINPDTKLAVNGTIHSKEVKVDLAGWPDYVFKPKYNLLSLLEVKTYIDQNHHLPDMPAAADVEKNGINLGEMNKLLTKKVEELTLYQIKHEEKNNLQETRIAALEKALAKLIASSSK